MNIDFQHFKMFVDITHVDRLETDIRKTFADLIYKNANGVVALDLSMRIYRSEGPLELTAEEMDFLNIFVRDTTTPIFMDSFKENISNG